MHRRFVPAVVALCLTVASSSAAFAQPSDPANPAESVGTARTTVDLGSVSLGDVRSGAIATVTSFASTDDDPARNDLGDGVPFALAGVQLPGGTELTATSDGASPVPGRSVELPAGLGAVRTGGLTAEVADGTARSLVETLDARLTPLGLTAATPEAGSTARVDAATATTTDGLVVENLSLGVGDLLGDDLLAALPLDVLLRLTDDLGLDLADLDLDAVVAQLEAIVDGIDDVEAVQAEIDDAQAAVTEAAAAVEEAGAAVDAAQTVFETAAAALRDAEADLADAEDDLAEAQALLDACLAACDALEATVDGLTAEVVAARDDVAQRTAAVADADTALDAAAGCSPTRVPRSTTPRTSSRISSPSSTT